MRAVPLTVSTAGRELARIHSERMADVFSRKKRSEIMSRIRSRDTKPELLLRAALHRSGLRFTVNGPLNRELPGRPDIVLPRYGAVVFAHGCYWHRHRGCKLAYEPKTRVEWWNAKFEANVARDRLVSGRLRRLGWAVYTVWECQIRKSPEEAAGRVARKLGWG